MKNIDFSAAFLATTVDYTENCLAMITFGNIVDAVQLTIDRDSVASAVTASDDYGAIVVPATCYMYEMTASINTAINFTSAL